MKTPSRATPQVSVLNQGSNLDPLQIDPDVLLPSQIRPRSNTLHRSEWLLLWALLTDALQVLASFNPSRPGRSYKEKKQWEADRAWVYEESEAPFSLAYVCDHLGLTGSERAVTEHAERPREHIGRAAAVACDDHRVEHGATLAAERASRVQAEDQAFNAGIEAAMNALSGVFMSNEKKPDWHSIRKAVRRLSRPSVRPEQAEEC